MATKKTKNKESAKSSGLFFTDNAWEDYIYWQKEDGKILTRINELIEACQRDPFKGIGKPEPLKNNLTGFWSRRIDLDHRLVYLFDDGVLTIIQCRYHYDK